MNTVYVVAKNRKTKHTRVFDYQNKNKAQNGIADNWDNYAPITIFEGTQLSFTISYEDKPEVIIKKKAKADID